MTESPDRQSEEPNELPDGEGDFIRPLPDGGLGDAMPDWLRRPPAWRGLTDPEASAQPVAPAHVIPEAVIPQAETLIVSTPRELSPEDHSEIDPKRLIDLDDLPDWLRELGARKIGHASHAGQVTVETGSASPAGGDPASQLLDRTGNDLDESPLDVKVGGLDAPQASDIDVRGDDTPQFLTKIVTDGASAPTPAAEHPLWQRPLVIVVAVAIAVVVIVAILVIARVIP